MRSFWGILLIKLYRLKYNAYYISIMTSIKHIQ
nr:MAG TPA: hypothetical protein [Caudoviricetes sp.]